MSVIIFDTETFGVIKSINDDVENLSNWPKIKQICWQTFDLNGNLKKNENHYFTNEELGKSNVLKTFIEDFQNSKLSIAHNFLFDFKIITAELIRHKLPSNSLENITVYDTMINNVELCGLVSEFGYAKYPTLTELYQNLFNKTFDGAHDAENDVKATAKCFWNIRNNEKIDFDKLPNVKEAILFEEEKTLEEILLFYSKRKEFGDELYNSCNSGIIGWIIEKYEKQIKDNDTNPELSPYNIHSNPKILINWVLELEKVFLNTAENKKAYFDYVEYKTLKETVQLLKDKNLYFPRESGKYHEPFALLYLSDSKKQHLDKFASMKLYEIIAQIITKFEESEKNIESKKESLIKDNSGCMLGILTLLTLGIIKYFA